LTEHSPYQRALNDALTNLTAWLPTDGGGANVPAWASQLNNFANSEQRQAYQETLQQILKRLEGDSFSEACFKFIRDAFAEGKPPEEATHPILRAWALATQLVPAGGASQPGTGENLWSPFFQDPIRYIWRVSSEQAGLYLQQAWEENVMVSLSGLPPADRLAALYGPGGKVNSFTEQFLKPLLTGPPPPFGEKAPLPPAIARALEDEKQLKPILTGGPQSVSVRAGRRSDIEGLVPLVEDQTILSITCTEKTYRVTTRPHDMSETEAIVQWSYQRCGDVGLTIYFSFFERYDRRKKQKEPPPPSPPKRIQLTKRYPGPTGFLRFLQDFMKGSHRFEINDFEPDPEASAILREGDNFVNVYYSVSVPPTLAKLVAALQTNPPQTSAIVPTYQ
jgi:hypothetical protein